nr:cytochrome C [Shewanella sp. 10N.286.48.B5]PMH84762.1 hypothetical protein BCU57_16640 [Shewanella sp. 10N.286.48.B5]
MMNNKKHIWAYSMSLAALVMAGCGNDGRDGEDGISPPPSSPSAKVLSLDIEDISVSEGNITLKFSAENEQGTPVTKINSIRVEAAQLLAPINGDSSAWQYLLNETCNEECPGELTDFANGQYQYTMGTNLADSSYFPNGYDASLPQRVILRVNGTELVPTTYQNTDYMVDGSELSFTRNIVDSQTCLSCHEDIASIKHGGDSLENCATCHSAGRVDDDKTWPIIAHQAHIGVSSETVGNCLACHNDEETTEHTEALNWQTMPTRENCSSCHNLEEANIDHSGMSDNSQCSSCHSAEHVYDKHRGKADAGIAGRSLMNVNISDAKIVDVEGESFAEIVVGLEDQQGQALPFTSTEAKDWDYLSGLELYVNWGIDVNFTQGQQDGIGLAGHMGQGRGYTVYGKTTKRMTSEQSGLRPLTPVHALVDGNLVYRVGPIEMNDTFAGDTSDNYGFISNRVFFCTDDLGQAATCGAEGVKSNATYNKRWFFDANGLRDEIKRRPIVSNKNCGSCHGYNEETDTTELNCRGCHSRKTESNLELANTTCFSGNDGEEAIAFKPMIPRGKGYGTSTADIVDACVACHNPNTPPTQAIRERHTVQGDKDFVEQLVVSHPDHKIWMHSLHNNQRATQKQPDWIRSVNYPANQANCYRCHEGDTFGAERLTEEGKPLALDLTYDPDSRAYPATDVNVDAYVSPVSATCYSCHAKRYDEDSNTMVIKPHVRAHMEQNGGRFGVPKDELETESCITCHKLDKLKQQHKLN